MKNKPLSPVWRWLALASILNLHSSASLAQTTAFTYQGRLTDHGNPASGTYDLTFTLFDAAANGNPVGSPLSVSPVSVTGGLFTVTLDFGPSAFNGNDRWLEIAGRTNGVGEFGVLTPRQKITAAPHSIFSRTALSAASATTAANVSGTVSAGQLTGTISSNNIGAGSITAVMLATGAVGSNHLASGAVTTSALADGAVTTTTLADGAVTATKVTTVSNWSALTIANPTPEDSDAFGGSVATVGTDRVLIGAHKFGGIVTFGAAYLFSSNGALLTTFTNPTPVNFDFFGYSVAAVGTDRVVIGAPNDDTSTTDAGAAYLFSTNGTLLTTFNDPTPATFDFFGGSVAAVGIERLVIGAPSDDIAASDAGAAFLFTTNGTLLTTFTDPTPASGDDFGHSVAAVGTDRVVIGAPHDDLGTSDAGAAFLFSTNGALLATFTNPTPASGDQFGYSVAVVGIDKVLIGAPKDNTGVSAAGAAYLFSTNGMLISTFTNPTPASGDQFGYSVAAVGTDRVLIGAFSDDTGADNAGAAYLFSTNGTLISTFTNPTPAVGDVFGVSVGALGSRVLIGASGDDIGNASAGSAYLFTLETYTPGLVADSVNARSITTASLEDGAVTAAKVGGVLFASQIPNLDGSKITSGAVPSAALGNAWKTSGNSGTTPGTHFIGTTDNRPLEFKVHGLRAMRFEDNGDGGDFGTTPDGAPNVIGGSPYNFVAAGIVGATIAGGGATNFISLPATNSVSADYGTVGGGRANSIQALSDEATIGGGGGNRVQTDADWSTIGGGNGNVTQGASSTIGGGNGNKIEIYAGVSTIGGGSQNHIQSYSSGSTIGGGMLNAINNEADFSTIGGGVVNTNIGPYATIPGGDNNVAGTNCFAAGHRANATHTGSFVWADSTDTDFATTAKNQFLIRASGGVGIGTTSPSRELEVQHASDTEIGLKSTDGGGHLWTLQSSGMASGDERDASFQIIDRTLNSSRLLIGTNGFVGIGTTAPTNRLQVNGGVSATAFVTTSDRNAKENFSPVSPQEVLAKVAALPITTWTFKEMQDGRHMGPMAQDFYAAFGLGGGDTTITSMDPDGVALAAIQGLNQKLTDALKQKETEITELKQRVAELNALVRQLVPVASGGSK